MIIKHDSILYRTNQGWKYKVLLNSFIPASIIFGLGFLYSASEWQYLACVTTAGSIAIISFIIAFTIQCPSCKSRWWWEALKSPALGKGLVLFASQKACPTCGYSNENGT